jgi:hypothetical protein
VVDLRGTEEGRECRGFLVGDLPVRPGNLEGFIGREKLASLGLAFPKRETLVCQRIRKKVLYRLSQPPKCVFLAVSESLWE